MRVPLMFSMASEARIVPIKKARGLITSATGFQSKVVDDQEVQLPILHSSPPLLASCFLWILPQKPTDLKRGAIWPAFASRAAAAMQKDVSEGAVVFQDRPSQKRRAPPPPAVPETRSGLDLTAKVDSRAKLVKRMAN